MAGSAGDPSLDSVRAKLTRADAHIDELARIIEPLAQRATESIVAEEILGLPKPRLAFRVTDVPPIPDACAVIVGDALYNMRSALDHFAAQLAYREGTSKISGTSFPIRAERPTDELGNPQRVSIPGVHDPAVLDALERVQPYELAARYGHTKWNLALWLVNKLCNVDKHRLLLVMVHRLDTDGASSPWWTGTGVAMRFTAKPLVSGEIVALAEGDELSPDLDPHISLAVTLEEGPSPCWPREQGVVTFLRGLRHSIAQDLNLWLVPFFAGEPILDRGPST